MMTIPLENGRYDLVLLSAICHMYSPEENRQLLSALTLRWRRTVGWWCRTSSSRPDKTAPRYAALFALNMLVATRAGASYSEPEYESG